MRLAVKKNGKDYRCDTCSKLLYVEEVCFWKDRTANKEFHFCTKKHKRDYIIENYNLKFPFTKDQPLTGNVIPVKNPGTDK